MTLTTDNQLLRKRQVAERLACSARTVERLVISGQLTKVSVRGGVRFRLSDVLQIVERGAK